MKELTRDELASRVAQERVIRSLGKQAATSALLIQVMLAIQVHEKRRSFMLCASGVYLGRLISLNLNCRGCGEVVQLQDRLPLKPALSGTSNF